MGEDKGCQHSANPTSTTTETSMAAPPMNVYKINYDGQVFAGTHKLGIGVVIRDCHGQIIAVLVQQLGQAYQLLDVEALAACRALEFGSELGIHREIVEGDSEVVVKALGNLDNGFHSYGLLINDAALFSGLVSELLYSYTRRDGNKVAHSLA